MLALPDCKMTFVCGPVASGKTHLIKQWVATNNRHVIFDGSGEFLEERDVEQIWANPKALHERLKQNPYYYRIVYQPGIDREGDFAWVLKAMWWIDQPKLLVCDEFHEICPVDRKSPDVEMMLRFARHDKLGFVGASQRIADVNRLYTSACRMIVLFYTQEARDLEAIEQRWRCRAMVEGLRPLLHDDVTGETKQIPQCVVIEKGKRPYVYDFKTQAVASGTVADDESDSERDESSDDEPINEVEDERPQEIPSTPEASNQG
jgi:hypothetical protein